MKLDTIIIGGGESGLKKGMQKLAEGKRVAIVSAGKSTISIRYAAENVQDYIPRLQEGVKREADMKREFRNAGGILLEGDEVVSAGLEATPDGKLKVTNVTTSKLDDELLRADEFFLASGSFVSRGLISSYMGVTEPIFNIDIEGAVPTKDMVNVDFFAPQAFMGVHVAVDADGCALKEGKTVVNLFPIGSIATGYKQTSQK